VTSWETCSPAQLAIIFDVEHQALSQHTTGPERILCRKYSAMLQKAPADYVREFSRQLLITHSHRWQAYEIIASHKALFRSLGASDLEQFGQGIDSWWSVDAFARTLAGPLWREGLVSDGLFSKWARSPDLWWRRAALVSTVAFNLRSQGGTGDTARTLAICRLLAPDHADMVVKGLSWALRELVYFDRQAVEGFLQDYDTVLAGRVKREVGSKLRTGLKYKVKYISKG
jgi:3-methyladenine DNA glycosylase AlkD